MNAAGSREVYARVARVAAGATVVVGSLLPGAAVAQVVPTSGSVVTVPAEPGSRCQKGLYPSCGGMRDPPS